jgi:hypothetical protein
MSESIHIVSSNPWRNAAVANSFRAWSIAAYPGTRHTGYPRCSNPNSALSHAGSILPPTGTSTTHRDGSLDCRVESLILVSFAKVP